MRKMEEMKNEDKVIGQIFMTKDYEKFSNLNCNRELDQSNLKALIASMSQNYYISPILVDNQDKIVDGQHRLEAIRTLCKPLYYIRTQMQEEESIEAIKNLNKVSKTWTLLDYIKYYANRGNENYINLLKLRQEFPEIKNIHIYIFIGQDSFRRGDKCNNFNKGGGHVKNGDYTFIKYEKAVETCKKLYDYKHLKNIFGTELFKNTMLRIFKLKSYNHKEMMKCMNKHAESLKSFGRIEDLLIQITELYNLGKRNRINFYTEYKQWLEKENKKRLEIFKKSFTKKRK